jgi:hypothetical protein
MNNNFYKLPEIQNRLFDNCALLPTANELFELELANLEYELMTKEELIEKSAFFESVEGKLTKHFKFCSNSNGSSIQSRSLQTQAYFEDGKFSTGYATHGLFPYRGKFHPQLIKAILNIIGVRKGDAILDPMCGSGTANIEAALMGVNSFAVDQSPFCRFMTKTKFEAMTIESGLLDGLSGKADKLFEFFNVKDVTQQLRKIKNPDKLKVYHVVLLAFLDAMGYSMRVTKSGHEELFVKVLNRYVDTISDLLKNPYFNSSLLGKVEVLEESSALKINLPDTSVDGVITSPPYSFAIDYVENDEPQLKYLGYDPAEIRSKMVGLVGKNKNERLHNYFRDMALACSEISRILKDGKFFVMIIGSNTNQTGGIRLEQNIIDSCKEVRLKLVKSIVKPIKGLRNTMKDEYMLFFEKQR